MALLVQNSGENLLLQWAIKDTSTPENLTLKLYSNNVTPAADDVAGDYTEATFTGYAAETLSRASWGSVATNGSGKAEISYGSALSWDATSAQDIYGYFVVGATSGTLVYSEKFATARALDNGSNLTFTPKITLASE